MTQPVPPPASDEASLQFDRAEFTETPSATKCSFCERAIQSVYFEANQRLLCPACREGVEAAMKDGSKSKHFVKASVFGFGAAIAGALVYWVVSLTGYNIGLIAILVGWLVGTAVFKGSERRGGGGYQALAVVLTYLSVAASLFPELYNVVKQREEWRFQHGMLHGDRSQVLPVDVGRSMMDDFPRVAMVSVGLPVIMGIERPMSGLIYCFALFEAWRRTKRTVLNITGPFKLAEAPAGDEAAPAEQERSVG